MYRVANNWFYQGTSNSLLVNYDSTQAPFDIVYYTPGDTTICLVVSNDFECSDSVCIDIALFPEPNTEVPNVFTPNGDNMNDTWFLNTAGLESVSCTILNRWGNVVMEITNVDVTAIDGHWNGQVMNDGAKCNDGVYSYVYQATAINGQTFEGNGFIQLMMK